MTLPVTVPNTFANATTSIPLANLDANFTTIYAAVNGIGNGSETLANVQVSGGTLSNVTLDNVTVDVETLSNVTLVDVTVTSGNATFTTANATTVDTTNIEVTNIKAKDGTASVSIADSTGIPTISKATVIETTDNTNAALRITQLGTGNALLVEDSANPDATPFVIDASGRLLIGTTTSDSTTVTANSQVQLSAASGTGSTINMTSWSAGSVPPFLQINKSNSGTVGSRGVVSSGDSLGGIQFNGDDGTAFIRGAQIVAVVDGTPGTNDMPGRLVFFTTADGASSPTERMRITSTGQIGIGGSPFGNSQLMLTGAVATIDTSFHAVRVNSTSPAIVTGTASGFFTTMSGAASGSPYTTSTVAHFNSTGYTLGSNQTVTNQYGFNASSGLTGATNNYGFYSNIASGTGRWNFYANGTADNYFAGNVGIGTSSPGARLDVNFSSGNSSNNDEIARFSGNSSAANGTSRYITILGTNATFGAKYLDAGGWGAAITGNSMISFSTGTTIGSTTERARITSDGALRVACENFANQPSSTNFGVEINNTNASSTFFGQGTGTESQITFGNRNGIRGSIQTNATNTLYNTTSDYRLKENVALMTGALVKVSQLKPSTYTWKVNGSAGQGFIAHELAEVIPDAVTGEKDAVDEKGDPKYQMVDTSFLVATLTSAIQELKAINDAQASRIETLEAKVAALENA